MNLFEAVKESVSPKQIAEYYSMNVRGEMAECIFHDDKNPSMKLYDDHFYCFGCGRHGDVTDLVSELFGIPPKKAAEKIAHDFGIPYDNKHSRCEPSKSGIVARIKREQDKAKENYTFILLCDYLHLLRDWRTEYAPKSADEPLNPLFIKALNETDRIDNLIECFISGSKEDKANVINNETATLAKIEKTIKQFSRSECSVENVI